MTDWTEAYLARVRQPKLILGLLGSIAAVSFIAFWLGLEPAIAHYTSLLLGMVAPLAPELSAALVASISPRQQSAAKLPHSARRRSGARLVYVALGSAISLLPMASFVLLTLEVFMVYTVARSYDTANLGNLVRFCTFMMLASLALKFMAAWVHLLPVFLGPAVNALINAAFIFYVYGIADSHYKRISDRKRFTTEGRRLG